MSRTAIIVVGHSHMSSVIKYLVPRAAEAGGVTSPCEYMIFDTHRHGADFQFSVDSGGGHYVLNPKIEELVDAKAPPSMERVYVSMFGGNAHNALTLLRHPRSFDVILPNKPDLDRVADAELVPSALIKNFIRKFSEGYILNMATLKRVTSGKVFHLESPPPIGDSEFVLSHLEEYFKNQQDRPVVAPAMLRYKMWNLHSEVVREASTAMGMEFLECPEGVFDEAGFLIPEAYGDDSTHAGAVYGGLMLSALEKKLNVHYDGWSWL